MSKSAKKQEEIYVKDFARKAGLTWHIVKSREAPDFIVEAGGRNFGLEVTQALMGDTGSGSPLRRQEGAARKVVSSIAREYERQRGVPINVQFRQPPEERDVHQLTGQLVGLEMDKYPLLTTIEVAWRQGIMRVQRSHWNSWVIVKDAVGLVDVSGAPLLRQAIEKKEPKLSTYRKCIEDVRLLVVADGMLNSGKIRVPVETEIDLRGFSKIYFFSYPTETLSWPATE